MQTLSLSLLPPAQFLPSLISIQRPQFAPFANSVAVLSAMKGSCTKRCQIQQMRCTEFDAICTRASLISIQTPHWKSRPLLLPLPALPPAAAHTKAQRSVANATHNKRQVAYLLTVVVGHFAGRHAAAREWRAHRLEVRRLGAVPAAADAAAAAAAAAVAVAAAACTHTVTFVPLFVQYCFVASEQNRKRYNVSDKGQAVTGLGLCTAAYAQPGFTLAEDMC